MYVSRQKTRLEAAKVLPRPRLSLNIMASVSSQFKALEPLSYVTISLFITFINSFLYVCV